MSSRRAKMDTKTKSASKKMESKEYPKEMLNGLNNLREQDQLCDVIISVGGKSFSAHKTVLAATGDYFLAMFTSGFRESSENKIKIDGSAKAFKILLEFAYTSEVEILQVAACIYEVVEMACYTQLKRFAETCSSAIEEVLKDGTGRYNISVNDVCKVMFLAEKHSYLKHLHEASLKYLEDKVVSVKSLDIFLEHTSVTLLRGFLSREDLSSEDGEKQVLELVINWLKHDWEKRKNHSHQLLQKVRLGLVTSEDIKELVGPEILDIPECVELVNHVLDVHASKKPRDVLVIENPDIAATRSTIKAPIIISYYGNFQFYAEEHNDWVALDKFDPLPSKTAEYSMVVADGILYALGGKEGTKFYSYQAGANKWLQLPPMARRQNSTKLVSFGGYIYAVGILRRNGFVLAPRLNFEGPGILIERYDIKENTWESIEPPTDNQHNNLENVPNNMRSDEDGRQAISVLVFEGKILVSSLRAMLSGNYYDTAKYEEFMMYDPELDNWQVTVIGEVERDDNVIEWDEDYEEDPFTDPVLFIYKDKLYRFVDTYQDVDGTHGVQASRLVLTSQADGTIAVSMEQDSLLSVEGGSTVCIKHPGIADKLFNIKMGVVCIDTMYDNNDGSEENVVLEPDNLALFPKFYTENVTSNPVWFSFDRKKLSSPYYRHESDSDSDNDSDSDSYF